VPHLPVVYALRQCKARPVCESMVLRRLGPAVKNVAVQLSQLQTVWDVGGAETLLSPPCMHEYACQSVAVVVLAAAGNAATAIIAAVGCHLRLAAVMRGSELTCSGLPATLPCATSTPDAIHEKHNDLLLVCYKRMIEGAGSQHGCFRKQDPHRSTQTPGQSP
jgi:hypothetical protein